MTPFMPTGVKKPQAESQRRRFRRQDLRRLYSKGLEEIFTSLGSLNSACSQGCKEYKTDRSRKGMEAGALFQFAGKGLYLIALPSVPFTRMCEWSYGHKGQELPYKL